MIERTSPQITSSVNLSQPCVSVPAILLEDGNDTPIIAHNELADLAGPGDNSTEKEDVPSKAYRHCGRHWKTLATIAGFHFTGQSFITQIHINVNF